MANKHMERFSTSLTIRKTPVKPTMKNFYGTRRMAAIKKTNHIKCR